MKKLFFIPLFIICANIDTASCQLQAKSPVEQLVHIMIPDTKVTDCPYRLFKKRTPNDYQAVYDLVKKHPELLQGIIHDGQTFAMLCVKRGYADQLTRLINEGCPIDLATPSNLCGTHNPPTTVLHELFGRLIMMQSRMFKSVFPEDYIEGIIELTKLIIKKCPDLLDMKIDRAKTARQHAWFLMRNAFPGGGIGIQLPEKK